MALIRMSWTKIQKNGKKWQEIAQEYQAECRLRSKGLQHPIGFVH